MLQPALASIIAVAFPIPREAPVIKATFPFRLTTILLSQRFSAPLAHCKNNIRYEYESISKDCWADWCENQKILDTILAEILPLFASPSSEHNPESPSTALRHEIL